MRASVRMNSAFEQFAHVLLGLSMCVSLAFVGGCSKKSSSPKGSDWVVGPASVYPVESSSQITVPDSVTGQHFVLPEGGHGNLHVARIVSGPESPLAGSGFTVSFDQEVPVLFVVSAAGSAGVTVMGYGTAPGAYDDIPGPGHRWVAVPRVDSTAEGYVFQLNLPFTSLTRTSKSAGTRADTSGFDQYWYSSIPAGSDDATKRIHLELQSKTFIDGILSRLSDSRRAAAQAEIQGRLSPHYEWDGFFYTGFWWRSLGSRGRLIHPTIHLRLSANAGNIAHETGHYITHVLVGDDTWSTLEGQAPLWDNDHGIRDNVGREMVLEDYAYFMEWLMIGTVKLYDLQDPYVIFGGMSPLTADFPSIEGFSSVLLASLTRTTPSMRSLIGGHPVDVPVIGMTNAQVFDIIAARATGIEGLRDQIASAAGAEASKLPAIFQRSGWRYAVKGRLLTAEGTPLAGATVSSVSIVGDHTYEGGTSSIPSDANGRFTITGEVFPGDSKIRVINGQDTTDVPISIAWSRHTNETVELGDLKVVRAINLSALHACGVELVTDAILHTVSSTEDRQDHYYWHELPGPVPGSFTGSQFTGNLDTTDDIGNRNTSHVTASVDPKTGDLLSLVLDQTSYVALGGFTTTVHIALSNIKKTSYSASPPAITLECSVFDEESCRHITGYTWEEANEVVTTTMTSYNCAPDLAHGYKSEVHVFFFGN